MWIRRPEQESGSVLGSVWVDDVVINENVVAGMERIEMVKMMMVFDEDMIEI